MLLGCLTTAAILVTGLITMTRPNTGVQQQRLMRMRIAAQFVTAGIATAGIGGYTFFRTTNAPAVGRD